MTKLLPFALPFLLALAVPATAQDSPDRIPVERIAAVAGDEVILLTEVEERLAQFAQELAQRGQRLPSDPAALHELRMQIIDRMINDALMVQRAEALDVEVADEEIAGGVDRRLAAIRQNFGSDAEFRAELRRVGFGTPDEFRRRLMDQDRRAALQQRLIGKLRQDGKLPPVPVSDAEVERYFNENRAELPPVPASVSFRQVIVTPRAGEDARQATRAKAESLLVELRGGGDFALIAKRESMDPGSKDQGGDLGWRRRNEFVQEFENMMLAMPVGQVSPVFETTFGYHILRVDRAQAGEYKVRHILLRPPIDSADVQRARAQADSVAMLWRQGTSFDTLAARYHDQTEDKSIPQAFPREQLPEAYRTAFEGKAKGEITDPFPIGDPRTSAPKFVVAQLTDVVEAHEPTLEDFRERIREQISEERAFLRLIQQLREANYVRVFL